MSSSGSDGLAAHLLRNCAWIPTTDFRDCHVRRQSGQQLSLHGTVDTVTFDDNLAHSKPHALLKFYATSNIYKSATH
jgi:hypothetical protein